MDTLLNEEKIGRLSFLADSKKQKRDISVESGKIGPVPWIAGSLFLILTIAIFVIQLLGFLANTVLVNFQLDAPGEKAVYLIGDFNNWDPAGIPMRNSGNIWEISIRLDKGKIYTYNFLLSSGDFITDPGATRIVEDGFGGEASVIEVK